MVITERMSSTGMPFQRVELTGCNPKTPPPIKTKTAAALQAQRATVGTKPSLGARPIACKPARTASPQSQTDTSAGRQC